MGFGGRTVIVSGFMLDAREYGYGTARIDGADRVRSRVGDDQPSIVQKCDLRRRMQPARKNGSVSILGDLPNAVLFAVRDVDISVEDRDPERLAKFAVAACEGRDAIREARRRTPDPAA